MIDFDLLIKERAARVRRALAEAGDLRIDRRACRRPAVQTPGRSIVLPDGERVVHTFLTFAWTANLAPNAPVFACHTTVTITGEMPEMA
jgi:hypothetical protein